MEYQKPAIHIMVNNPCQVLLRQLTAGLEEEGILLEITYHQEENLYSLGWLAAEKSLLGIGIGMKEECAILQCYPMGKGNPLFSVDRGNKEDFRVLGSNAGRYARKVPFKKLI